MPLHLKGRNLISMNDLSREEIKTLMKTTQILKIERQTGASHELLKGKILAMIFEKPSTRTRVSFEAGIIQLGGSAIYLSSSDLQLKRGETISDTARVLSRYVDIIMARVFAHQTVSELACYSSVPVINGLSDDEHPCQILGDLFTIWEKKERFEGLKMAYIGDGNNVCNSLLIGAAKVGINIHTAHPEGYFPRDEFVKTATLIAKENKCEVKIGSNPIEAVKDADVIYTDVWVSMGQEKKGNEKKNLFEKYRVDSALLEYSKKDSIVLHCLPAHRGEEITDEVMDGPRSAVFDEAENRLHAQKAIMVSLI